MATSGGPNSPESKRRNLILGNFKTISHDRHFISPIAAPSTKFLNSGNSTGHANGRQAESQMTSTPLNYDPIVPVKKRKSKNFRISKNRRVINTLETQTFDNPKLPENEFVSLVRENNDLREELANMVQVFEQYLKVASLKETIEHRENRRLWSDSPVDGGDVPNFKSYNVKGSSSTNQNSWDSLRQNQNANANATTSPVPFSIKKTEPTTKHGVGKTRLESMINTSRQTPREHNTKVLHQNDSSASSDQKRSDNSFYVP